ncbi:MAG: hypothetical protein H0T77_12065 [Pyrinomonadaceae bacterium]|nr:hypothetical protein [Pyrinomonadaceae bacterium]
MWLHGLLRRTDGRVRASYWSETQLRSGDWHVGGRRMIAEMLDLLLDPLHDEFPALFGDSREEPGVAATTALPAQVSAPPLEAFPRLLSPRDLLR